VDLGEYLSKHAFVKAFVKGPPGEGKTVLASQVTHLWKTLYIDAEGGVVSAIPFMNRDNLTVQIIREQDPSQFFLRLQEAMDEAESGRYEAVVVDSLTEIASRMEDDYAIKGETGFDKWSGLLERMKRFARRLRDMKCHVIATGITKPVARDDSGSTYEPAISGQASAFVPSYFDVVGLMRKKATKSIVEYYFATTGPSAFQIRDRWRALAPEERVDEGKPGEIWKKLWVGIQKVTQSGSSTKKQVDTLASAK
jgi:hypothetical protein